MKIVRVVIPEETVEKLANMESPEIVRVRRAAEWGPTSLGGSFDLQSNVMPEATAAPIVEALTAAALDHRVEDLTDEYQFGETLAPAAYDGFGTLVTGQTTDEWGLWRCVAIRRDALEWQTARYSSGARAFRRMDA